LLSTRRDLRRRLCGACRQRWRGAELRKKPEYRKAIGIMTTAVPARSSTKTRRVRPPMRLIDVMSVAEATPVMRSDTTNGITVMRMAFTQSVPNGAMKSAARTSDSLPEAAIAIPTMIAAPKAMRTRVPSLMELLPFYIIRSPPLMSNDAPVM
jgi:hypothetical protein